MQDESNDTLIFRKLPIVGTVNLPLLELNTFGRYSDATKSVKAYDLPSAGTHPLKLVSVMSIVSTYGRNSIVPSFGYIADIMSSMSLEDDESTIGADRSYVLLCVLSFMLRILNVFFSPKLFGIAYALV